MSIKQVEEAVRKFAQEEFSQEGKVTKVGKIQEGWLAEVEILETEEYRRTHALPDVIETYQLTLDEEYELIGFKRIKARGRGDIPQEGTEEGFEE